MKVKIILITLILMVVCISEGWMITSVRKGILINYEGLSESNLKFISLAWFFAAGIVPIIGFFGIAPLIDGSKKSSKRTDQQLKPRNLRFSKRPQPHFSVTTRPLGPKQYKCVSVTRQ
jgi:hypothetical protein